MTPTGKIRVLLVDDSLVTRRLFAHLLGSVPDFELVGEAGDGEQAIAMVDKLRPDVVSMDIEMPRINGIEATRQIMEKFPVPVVIVSSLYSPGETGLAMEVLAAGAVAVIPKPAGPGNADHQKHAAQYLRTMRAMAGVKVVRRKAKSIALPDQSGTDDQQALPKGNYGLVVIGASAGGPEVVRKILNQLPADFPLPVAIVQHIDSNFALGFAQWLASTAKIRIEMLTGDAPLKPGHVYLSIRPLHLVVKSLHTIGLSDHDAVNGLKPSVASLFKSAGEVFGGRLIAVMLSGMGSDGAAEMYQLRQLGAYNIIQDEPSCLVYGMPGEAARLGAHHVALPPDKIASHIMNLVINSTI